MKKKESADGEGNKTSGVVVRAVLVMREVEVVVMVLVVVVVMRDGYLTVLVTL